MVTIILKYRIWISKSSETECTLDLLVTKEIIIRNSIEFIMEWRRLVHKVISDWNIE